MEAVKKNGLALQYYAIEELQDDKEFIMEAIKKHPYAFQYGSEELQNDKEAVMKGIKKNGVAFQYANEELRNDKEVVMDRSCQERWLCITISCK